MCVDLVDVEERHSGEDNLFDSLALLLETIIVHCEPIVDLQ